MLEKYLVSIIIPTYNRAHLIGETLDSVLAQTYMNWECIVVDDGSTDGTESLLNTYIAKDSRFQYHIRPSMHLPGGNGARNYGFKLSKGDYIQWFDSDDLMMPNKIQLSVFEIQSKKKELVVSNLNLLGSHFSKKALEFDDLLKFHITHGINTPMCFFEKRALNGYIFNESLVRSQEFEFFTRLFGSKKITFSIIQESLCEIRSHNDSITGKFEKGDKDSIASMLYSKLVAVNLSKRFDLETQKITTKHFEKALWKSLIYRHKKLYWKYLNLYSNQNISYNRKMKLGALAVFYFAFNRGGQLIKTQFFK